MSKRKAEAEGEPNANSSAREDAALAELLTLLDPAPFTTEACIMALQRSRGDVSAAAELLLVGGTGESSRSGSQTPASSQSRKRARQGGLAQWFKAPKREAGDTVKPQISPPPSHADFAYIGSPSSPSPDAPPSPVDRGASAANWAALLSRPPAPPVAKEKVRTAPQRPAFLASPAAVAASGLPLALLPSPLQLPFAAQLFHEMMGESLKWGRNKFFIAGREVESNHQATGYARRGEEWDATGPSAYYYNGTRYDAKPYTPCLAKAAEMVEEAVNTYLDGVPRYPLEYKGRWRANACAANRYDGAQATVGFHSDQMTYLGPYPTIASLSLGTPRAFRLRGVATADAAYAPDEPPRTYEVTLGNNSLVLMTAGCQERYKHTIPPQRALDTFRIGWDAEGKPIPPDEQKPYTSRINITFRFFRDDFRPEPSTGPRGECSGTPHCKCGFPTILRADQRAKARSALGATRGSGAVSGGVVDDDMVYFWQCATPSRTSDMKGCGFFKILDMHGEGRGPCWGDERVEKCGDEGAGEAAEAAELAAVSNGA